MAAKPANRTYVGPYSTFHIATVAARRFCDQVTACRACSPACRTSLKAPIGAQSDD